ncbi:putative NADPH-cytochrome P450 reductase [Halenospora varia]|nr:putative NADPH-cytochrome P450 reductase [Halenospora varia]
MASTYNSSSLFPLSYSRKWSSLDSFPTPLLPATLDDSLGLLVIFAVSIAYLSRGRFWDKKDPLHHLWFEKPQADLGERGLASLNRSIAIKLEETNKDIVIFWGSQSGTAERLAVRLSRELRRRFGIEAILADLSDYDAASIAQIPSTKVAIFILSTYGDGDPPDNVNELWSWIAANEDASLRSLRYAGFGLGNSNYNAYNRVIDVVAEAFDKLGAQSLLSVGKADDLRGSTVEDFLSWQDALFGALTTILHYRQQDFGYQPTLSTVYDESMDIIDLHLGEPIEPRQGKKGDPERSKIHLLPLKESRELFSNSERSCLHLEFDLSHHAQLKYKTGDHLAVWPQNPEEAVERLLDVLGVQSQRNLPLSISIAEPGTELKFPTPTTLNALFKHYLDICGPISRDLLSSLIQFAPSKSSKSLLEQLSSDGAACTQYLARKYVTIGQLLVDLGGAGTTWSSIPLSFLLEYLPPMKPRYYSISSSSVVQPQSIAITTLVSNIPINGDINNRLPGLTTNYMARMTPPSKLHAHVQRSRFKLPISATTPLILIAAGTGIAPFRAFLAERMRLHRMNRLIGRCLLFYGARSAHSEFLYADELAQVHKELGTALVEVVTAFSRDEAEGQGSPITGKCYVQDQVKERFGDVATLVLEKNAWIYICGSAGMGQGVGRVMGECFEGEMGWDGERYREWAAQMKRTRKWQEDVWG